MLAFKLVGDGISAQGVGTFATEDLIIPAQPHQAVVTDPAVEVVVPLAPEQHVVVVAPEQPVVPEPAVHRVVPGPAEQGVVPLIAEDLVALTGDTVVRVAAQDGVVVRAPADLGLHPVVRLEQAQVDEVGPGRKALGERKVVGDLVVAALQRGRRQVFRRDGRGHRNARCRGGSSPWHPP